MGLEVNKIITLDNLKKYIVLNETFYAGKKYFLTMGINEKMETDANEVVIFEEEMDGLDCYVIKVKDSLLLKDLTNAMKEQN